ncbi:hypothetical protein [Aquitalea sp. LB_tupeE]|nr:hypothetical protein [Aquitalea sp. LB_tupeE]
MEQQANNRQAMVNGRGDHVEIPQPGWYGKRQTIPDILNLKEQLY